jgi:hypothetical protein
MSSFSKIKKVIVLKPGEKFTIPPDSTLLSTTGILSSTGCPVPTPEAYECFGVAFSIAYQDGGSSEPLDEITLKGFKIGNQEYLFTSGLVLNSGSLNFTITLINKINTNESLKTMLSDVCGAIYASSPGRGGKFITSFKSFPSLMTNAFLITEIYGGPFAGGKMDAYLPVKTRTQLTTEGVNTVTCTCS